MYEFVEIDGGWQVYWGPQPANEEKNPTPPNKAVILPFVQIEGPARMELEYAVAA